MLWGCAALLWAQPSRFPDGVASGDVTAYSAVLWTRTARPAAVEAEVAADADFRLIRFRGTAVTTEDGGLAAKLEAWPLSPATQYYYRWKSAGSVSETGTFRTAPAPGETTGLRFVFAGDSDGTMVNGKPAFNRFEVLDAARREDADFFIYLGDTVYTDSEKRGSGPAATLDEYRSAYAVNRSYPALRELMRSTSTFALWDDHEFRNDFSPAGLPAGLYEIGRRAFLEWMPVRESHMPADPGCAGRPMFRIIRWGTEALLIVLDERTCRSPSAASKCLDRTGAPDLAPTLPAALRTLAGLREPVAPGCLAAIADSSRTMIGQTQRELLMLALRYFPARFKFVVSEVPVTQLYALPYDRWEGYAAERETLLRFIDEQRIPNVFFVTADLHATVSSTLYVQGADGPRKVAMELVTGPIAVDPLLKTLSGYAGFNPAAFSFLLPQLGIACYDLERMTYGVVEVDGGTGRVRLAVKDEMGKTVCGQPPAGPGF
ncbi:MAG: alkaline phosphatase D family protein [Bryobacteraceae bacterium]